MRGTRRSPRRRGSVAVWVIVTLAVLLGVVALGMDGGRMLDERQRVQAAADAAALAAGADTYERYNENKGTDPAGTARAAALRIAAANGYANDGVASVVAVHIPPVSGPFAGQDGHTEVVIDSNLPAGFSRVFGREAVPVRARAVARGKPKKIGLLILRPTGPNALQTGGSSTLRLIGAPVAVNSADPTAYTNTSNGLIQADSFEIVGEYRSSGPLVGPVHTGVQPTPDPLRTIPPPDPSAYLVRSTAPLTIDSQTVTLEPGVYVGGLTLKGGANVTFAPGVHIILGGGITMSGNSRITGTEAMLYNAGGAAAGPISLTGSGGISLTPPSDGLYAGISIFQDRAVTTRLDLGGNGSLSIGGIVYAPIAAVRISGSGSGPDMPVGGFIVWELTVSGSGDFVIDAGSARPRAPDVRLVD